MIHDNRRVYTDGRDWPSEIEPTFAGYSIGRWIDSDGVGRFDTLEIETRHLKGPRAYDTSGMPLHADNKTIVKESLHLDKTNPNLLLDEITTFDDALTSPLDRDQEMATRAIPIPGRIGWRRSAPRTTRMSKSKTTITSSAVTAC